MNNSYFCALLTLALSGLISFSYGQENTFEIPNDRYYRLIPGAENSKLNRVELYSDIDTTWQKWRLRGYNFGFNPEFTPMYTTVNGILSTPYMLQVRGNENEKNKKRWGYHVFEGYASDDKSRITMLARNCMVQPEYPVGRRSVRVNLKLTKALWPQKINELFIIKNI